MIDKPSDFIIVRGRHPTDAEPFGDLGRIALPFPLVAKRLGRLPMGVDAAWLQECVAERSHLLGRTIPAEVTTFDRVIRRAPLDAVAAEAALYLASRRFVISPEIDSTGEVADPADGAGHALESVAAIAEARSLCVTEPPYGLPLPPSSAVFRRDRVWTLERLMERLGCCVVALGSPGTVPAETVARSGTNDGFGVGTLVGTRTVYSEGAEAQLADGVWTESARETRTAKLGSLSGLSVSFPTQRYSASWLTKGAWLWVKVRVRHWWWPCDPGDEEPDHTLFLNLGRNPYGIGDIGRNELDAILSAVRRRWSFDMDPLSVDATGYQVVNKHVRLTVEVLAAEAVCELREAVVGLG